MEARNFERPAMSAANRARVWKQPSLICPQCKRQRLIDTGALTRSKMFRPGDPGFDTADYYQKCQRCKIEIGIKKI